MELIIAPDGVVHCIYGEDLDLKTLGQVRIRRASHVEVDEQGAWWADLSPVDGPVLGPFVNRTAALEVEVTWLTDHWLPLPGPIPSQETIACKVR